MDQNNYLTQLVDRLGEGLSPVARDMLEFSFKDISSPRDHWMNISGLVTGLNSVSRKRENRHLFYGFVSFDALRELEEKEFIIWEDKSFSLKNYYLTNLSNGDIEEIRKQSFTLNAEKEEIEVIYHMLQQKRSRGETLG